MQNTIRFQKQPRLAGGISVVGLIGVLATLLFSGSLFWMVAPKEHQQTPAITSSNVPLTHKRIQDIQPGQWVKADNPAEEDDTEFGYHVDPATWKLLKLKAPKLDGTLADVSLLRPDYWLTLQSATVGGTVYISVPECGIDGNAKVLAIEDCPPIAANPGPGFQIVTGTFQHQAAKILDIGVESESKPIGTTPNHPFWSVDRQAFVRADSLTVGERLQSLNGITTVASITPRGPPEPVYNLEVQVKHTYYVADSGVLVHNGKGCLPQPGDDDFIGPLERGGKKPFALGLDDHLDDFTKNHNATNFKKFADQDSWKTQVRNKILDPDQKILFNLQGLERQGGAWAAISRASSGRGGATDWELFEIYQNPQIWSSIEWFEGLVKKSNPFE